MWRLRKNKMKKLILLITSAILLANYSYSQNCKYEKNDVDQFTKKMTKLTKALKVFETKRSVGFMKIQRVDTKYSIMFLIDGDFNTRKEVKDGSELSFLLEGGKVITLKKGENNTYDISQ